MVFKQYRVGYRQGQHYFETLEKARAFIKNFIPNVVRYKLFVIEKLNAEKKAKNLPVNMIYDPYETWQLTNTGWKQERRR